MMTAVALRRLRTSDLDRIEELERESYPTPWSRSMFAGELAKPSGICLGAFQGESLGFVTTGVRRGYYTDNREDALIMWKDAEPPV